jgi:hypothetical protein
VSHPLEPVAATFAATIIDAIQREYPNDLRHRMDGPDDRPTPRQILPTFYGCYDWHSAVEMHWALTRLVRYCPDQIPAAARAVLDEHFSHEALTSEAAYLEDRPAFSRPYGWGWVFTLAEELATWPDTDAQRWVRDVAVLADVLSEGLQRWLPLVDYPVRVGMHPNSAFAFARGWRWSARDERLRSAIVDSAHRWYIDDREYPASWEPSGADFLSAALAEAELMSMALPGDEFVKWFDRFLPVVPASLLEPVSVTDTSDGQIAHLHGLNLHRAHGYRVVSTAVGGRADLDAAADRHLDASLDRVCGDDYMVEHWLAAFAVLALTGG